MDNEVFDVASRYLKPIEDTKPNGRRRKNRRKEQAKKQMTKFHTSMLPTSYIFALAFTHNGTHINPHNKRTNRHHTSYQNIIQTIYSSEEDDDDTRSLQH